MKRALAVLVMLAGCATPPRAWRAPDGAYGEALSKATRTTVLTKGLDTELIVYATEESAEFQRARTDQLADTFRVAPRDADGRLPELTAAAEGLVFLVAVNANERSWNDLDKRTSHWAVTLDTPAGPVLPLSIRRLDSTLPGLRGLYPYIDKQFVPYRLVFPVPVGGGAHALVVSGSLGQARLEF